MKLSVKQLSASLQFRCLESACARKTHTRVFQRLSFSSASFPSRCLGPRDSDRGALRATLSALNQKILFNR